MKFFLAALTACVAVPIGGSIGYVVKHDPAPSFGEYVLKNQGAKHVPGQDSDDWLAIAVTGPNKGGAMDLVRALSVYRTHKDLEGSAQGRVVYVERKCALYSTSGTKTITEKDRSIVTKCSQESKTRKQAEEYMVELLAPVPKA